MMLRLIEAALALVLAGHAGATAQTGDAAVRYLANGGTRDVTGRRVNADEIRDLKIVMPIPRDIRQRIAARTVRNVIFEVRIYDRAQRLQTLEGRVDFEKNLATIAGKASLTFWLVKPDGGSDFTFRTDAGSHPSLGEPGANPLAYQCARTEALGDSTVRIFKIKTRITPYWVVRTAFGAEEKGAPFYYPNETVPEVAIE